MPELPEVETVRRDLAAAVLGQTIDAVQIHGPRTVRRHDPGVLAAALPGRSIRAVRRHGKYLLAELDDANVLVVHLRMSGQLLWVERDVPVVKHTHARLWLGDHELRFVDPRTFGELWLSPSNLPAMSHIGPDALTGVLTPQALADRMAPRKSAIKAVLLNQSVIAGIGNIYSDEMLWRAKLRYSRIPSSLSRSALTRLHEAMLTVLDEAIEARGSSLRDAQYVDLYGRVGTNQLRLDVYDREHEPCRRCATPIRRASFGGRSTFFCPRCQR